MAASGLWTTPGDLAKFIIELQRSLNGEANNVLSQKTASTLLAPSASGRFGFGIEITARDTNHYFGHGGTNEGFTCRFIASLEGGKRIVIMTNGGRGTRFEH